MDPNKRRDKRFFTAAGVFGTTASQLYRAKAVLSKAYA